MPSHGRRARPLTITTLPRIRGLYNDAPQFLPPRVLQHREAASLGFVITASRSDRGRSLNGVRMPPNRRRRLRASPIPREGRGRDQQSGPDVVRAASRLGIEVQTSAMCRLF